MVKEILTLDEAKGYLSISKSLLYKMTSQKLIPHYKPNGGRVYFKKEDLDSWMLQNRQESVGEKEQKVISKLSKVLGDAEDIN